MNARRTLGNAQLSLRKILRSFLPVLLALPFILTSCEHKELCMHHTHAITIRVQYDWRYAPDASPRGMTVYFYNEDSGTPIVYNFNNTEGGYVSLPTGNYRILSYNNDTELTLFDRHNYFDEHLAYTRYGHVLEPVTGPQTPEPVGDEDVVVCPDDIWTCSAIDVSITEDGISYICQPWEEGMEDFGQKVETTEQLIVLYPHDILCHYSYEVRNVDGLDRVEQLSGALTGMSPSVQLSDEALHTTPVTLPFEGHMDLQGSCITGEFLTFGHHDSNLKEHRMLLYVWMKSGKKYLIGREGNAFNVTRQVDDAPNRRRVHIIIDRLKIPDDDQPGSGDNSGQEASADEWFENNIDIDI
ncbi:MAG: DUF5119 domain-containing protein [Muribaculum sp.]|nr:DUF5119 domain-containing protein [Muribaculum sp.]